VGKLAQNIIDRMSIACRAELSPGELGLFIGRMISWQLIESRVPAGMAPPEEGVSIGGGSLRILWSEIAECVALAELRYAFVDEHFPYERLSEETISYALRLARAAQRLDSDERIVLAEWVANAIVKDRPMGMFEFELPVEIARFAVDLMQVGAADTVYCPGPNNDMTSIAVMRLGAKPLIVGQLPPVVAALFACLTGKSFQFTHRDAYGLDVTNESSQTDSQFGIIFPPFGQRSAALKTSLQMQSEFGVRTSEALGVELALRSITKTAIVIVPNSLLFKAGPEQTLREHVIESGQLETVVSFPSGLLANTNLPISMLITRPACSSGTVTFCKVSESEHLSGHQGKLRSHDRRFIGEAEVLNLLRNPDGLTCISISAADIRSQDYSLVPDRFLDKQAGVLDSKRTESVLLGDIVTIVKPQLLPDSKGGDGVLVQEVSPGEMPVYGYLKSSQRTRNVDAKIFKARSSQVAQPGDILLSTKGTIGKVALCKPVEGASPLLPSLSSVVLRLDTSAAIHDARYLVMYLRSPAVQHALNKMAVGATIRNIALGELRALPVWVPPLLEQDKIIEAFDRQMELAQRAAAIAKEQEAVAETLWRDTGLDLQNQEAA
jgi:type I restriction-modification system DNA methylase subunit